MQISRRQIGCCPSDAGGDLDAYMLAELNREINSAVFEA
jgi:hypothetical protein